MLRFSGGLREETEIYGAIKQGNLANYLFLHGAMWGEDLDDIFNQCDFAIGSLHKWGLINRPCPYLHRLIC